MPFTGDPIVDNTGNRILQTYTLYLTNGKYYVGCSKNPKFRIEQHRQSNTSRSSISNVVWNGPGDFNTENIITIQLIDKYGVNNVTGGAFIDSTLSQYSTMFKEFNTIITINSGYDPKYIMQFVYNHATHKYPEWSRHIHASINNACIQCGASDHYGNECKKGYTCHHCTDKKCMSEKTCPVLLRKQVIASNVRITEMAIENDLANIKIQVRTDLLYKHRKQVEIQTQTIKQLLTLIDVGKKQQQEDKKKRQYRRTKLHRKCNAKKSNNATHTCYTF